jgi:hypothetical protein
MTDDKAEDAAANSQPEGDDLSFVICDLSFQTDTAPAFGIGFPEVKCFTLLLIRTAYR